MDSGAEKEVIRKAFPYLDFFIVQYCRASTNLFTFFEQLKALNFGDILEAYIDVKAYYEKTTEKQLDQETDRELETTLALCLFELKNLIGHDLKIDKQESDATF